MRSGALHRVLGEIRKTQPHSVENRKTNKWMHLFWHLSGMCWFPAQPLELGPIQGPWQHDGQMLTLAGLSRSPAQ